MQELSNGFITLYNGAVALVSGLVSPVVLLAALVGASFLWLGLIELDELNRQGTKPEVERGR
jgi:hypothetical protein